MTETRGGKYGRNLAYWVNATLNLFEYECDDYRKRFLEELQDYSLRPRKVGEPRNSGCVNELSGLVNIDLRNSEQFACLVKEGIHLMYQKKTSKRVLEALLENIEGP